MTCHRGRSGPDHDGDCYKLVVTAVVQNIQNKSHTDYLVLVGTNVRLFAPDFLYVSKGSTDTANAIDTVEIDVTQSFTASAPTNVASTFNNNIFSQDWFPKKLLVPPGYFLVSNGAATIFQLIQAATLDHALDIL